jgi:hypothetical protein
MIGEMLEQYNNEVVEVAVILTREFKEIHRKLGRLMADITALSAQVAGLQTDETAQAAVVSKALADIATEVANLTAGQTPSQAQIDSLTAAVTAVRAAYASVVATVAAADPIQPAPPSGGTSSIAGSITPASLSAGASVALSGQMSQTVVADANGNFAFAGLQNGTYTITPSASGHTFSPTSQSATISGTDINGVLFTEQ